MARASLETPGRRPAAPDRPEARNALSPEMMEEIASELERLDPDPEVRCIVIAGSERCSPPAPTSGR